MSKQSVYFKIPGLAGKQEAKSVKQNLAKIPGVTSVSVNAEADKVAVDYDSSGTNSQDICRCIKNLGIAAELIEKQNHVM